MVAFTLCLCEMCYNELCTSATLRLESAALKWDAAVAVAVAITLCNVMH